MPKNADFYKEIIDNLYDGVYFVDRNRRITFWNKGAERITGYTREQVLGRTCFDSLLNHISVEGAQLCKHQCPLAACMGDGKPREEDLFLHHAHGHRVPVLVRVAPMRDTLGNIVGAVETFSTDLGIRTVRRELHELRRTVREDKLTGIGNRSFLEGRIRAVLAELAHQKDSGAGLLFLDIDHFKKVNDLYGHEAGDKVLRMVASTLHHSVRRSDVVGRWGGEEFLAIVYDVSSPEELQIAAEKPRMLVEMSRLDLGGIGLTVTISLGATLFRPVDTPEAVVRRADALMYLSKENGRNRVTVG